MGLGMICSSSLVCMSFPYFAWALSVEEGALRTIVCLPSGAEQHVVQNRTNIDDCMT